MIRHVHLTVLSLVVAAGLALAQDVETPDPVEAAAAKARAAHAAGDTDALASASAGSEADVWGVAEALLVDGAADVATALAAASKDKDAARLAEYVAARAAGSADVTVTELEALLESGDELIEARNFAEALAQFAAGREGAEAIGWLRGAVRGAKGEGRVALNSGKPAIAEERFARQLELEEARGSLPGQSRALRNLAMVRVRLRRFDEGHAAYQRSVELARESGDEAELAQCLDMLGSFYSRVGQVAAAVPLFKEAVALKEKTGAGPSSLGGTLINFGGMFARTGESERAIELVERGLALVVEGGQRRFALNARTMLGQLYLGMERIDDAEVVLVEAHKEAQALGDDVTVAFCDNCLGAVQLARGEHQRAVELLEPALEVAQRANDQGMVGSAAIRLSGAYEQLGDHDAALRHARTAMEAAAMVRDGRTHVEALVRIGRMLLLLERPEEARQPFTAALRGADALRMHASAAVCSSALADSLRAEGDLSGAIAMVDRTLASLEAIAEPALDGEPLPEEARARVAERARLLAMTSELCYSLGRIDDGLERARRAVTLAEQASTLPSNLNARNWIARALSTRGDHEGAIAEYEQAIELAEEGGERLAAASLRVELALELSRDGRPEAARALAASARDIIATEGDAVRRHSLLLLESAIASQLDGPIRGAEIALESLKLAQEAGLEAMEVASSHAAVARSLTGAGRLAAVLRHREADVRLAEENGQDWRLWSALVELGGVYISVGNRDHARKLLERSLAEAEKIGHDIGAATALRALAHLNMNDPDAALPLLERARALHEKAVDPAGAAATDEIRATVLTLAGRLPEALELYRDVGARLTELGEYRRATRMRILELSCHIRLGNGAASLAAADEVVELARDSGVPSYEFSARLFQAMLHIERGDADGVVDATRAAAEVVPLMAGGLGQEEGAAIRDPWGFLAQAGIEAGAETRRVEDMFFLAESGRAGALLEALGGRDQIAATTIPDDVRAAEIAARRVVAAAQTRLQDALAARKLKEVRSAREDLAAANGELLVAVARVQSAAKLAANVAYPRAAELADVQAVLGPHEALVTYSVWTGNVVALVVTRDGTRIVPSQELGALPLFDDPAADLSEALAGMRQKLIDPLELGDDVTRVLVSPAGELAYVPFATLLPNRDVAFVPSGTTYLTLRDAGPVTGSRVLALGDPDYTKERDKHARSIYGRLAALPGTRAEAEAIGDVRLLGASATESGLRDALAQETRWRSVHLACHGLVNPDSPQTSALALTAGGGDDGFLTVNEIYGMEIAADLVVLSACETGRGKTYAAEGVVGFTQAFMLAGAPRVIVSLWKVDDQASAALMQHFYSVWRPKDGSQGVPAAEALRRAQEHVAAQDGWRHPYFWAAWQLWGLPE